MKKEIPLWATISAITVFVVVGGYFLVRATFGSGEMPPPKINVSDEVPDYIGDQMPPEMREQMREQAKKYGSGQSSNQGGGPPQQMPGPPNGS
ncbi:hypothetical protein QPK87_18000 [Kamptonema cortianum]|nr:hypothetical protein [Geitlerinema splendidum]MDK3158449.1 hypothetical protein [Kamptonema cortianum]